MMILRTAALIVALAFGIIWEPFAAEAQQAGKAYRVGVLSMGSRTGSLFYMLEEGLRERGWVEGRNIFFEYRFAEGRTERLPALAADLVRLNVDVIVTSLGATVAAKEATSRIPIVMQFGLTDVETGLVGGLARPSGNITGLTGDVTAEIMGKRLELLREIAPAARRVATLYKPFPGVEVYKREFEAAAQKLHFAPIYVEIHGPHELDQAFAAIQHAKADSLFCGGDPVTFPLRKQIADFALRARLPGVHGPREWGEAGGLVSYGVNLRDLYRQVAAYVNRILRGAKPAELPIERPLKYELVINLKTAKALGLTIPQSILIRADQIIQ